MYEPSEGTHLVFAAGAMNTVRENVTWRGIRRVSPLRDMLIPPAECTRPEQFSVALFKTAGQSPACHPNRPPGTPPNSDPYQRKAYTSYRTRIPCQGGAQKSVAAMKAPHELVSCHHDVERRQSGINFEKCCCVCSSRFGVGSWQLWSKQGLWSQSYC